MSIINQEALNERANNLAESSEFNGFKLVLVSLFPEDNPSEARLEVHFYTSNILSDLVIDESSPESIFPISGGQRIRAGAATGEVKVDSIEPVEDIDQVLVLTVSPIGDYSTYTLSIDHENFDPIFSEIDFKFRPVCFSIECAPEWESAPAPKEEPVIDYLAKDYDSFKHTLITAMMQRVPGWQPSSEADLDQTLIELFSAAADELSDYQDRVMNEAYLGTARKRVSLARHARLMDYHIHQGNQASTWLAFKLRADASTPARLPVWAGSDDMESPLAIVFSTQTEQAMYSLLNQLGLYTWGDSISALAAGSTSADLLLLVENADGYESDVDEETVIELQNHLREQYLLIQERLNPNTGQIAGRDPNKRQLLKLLAGDDGARAMQDPVTGVWFVRVWWEKQDALKTSYCFTVDCKEGKKNNISLFHGNLTQVFHGRPVEAVFRESGTDRLFLLTMEPTDIDILEGLTEALETLLDISLSDDSVVITIVPDLQWTITDRATKSEYLVEKIEDRLVVYLLHSNNSSKFERSKKQIAICKLLEAPLAYRETPIGGEVPPRSTLEVKVITHGSDDDWEEVINLIHSDDSDEHGDQFVVEADEEGRSQLRFGDGTNAKVLPEGAEVHCRYRAGWGPDGNIGYDQLRAFDATVCPEIQACWNPFDVINGRAPEPVNEVIRRAPEAFRSRQLRAITLQDYVNRAEELAGVSRAAARYAWTGSWRTVQITIDPIGTKVLEPSLRRTIERHLNAVRLIGEDLEIREPHFVPLDIEVSLCIHPDYWVEDIRYLLKQELSEGYTPDGRMGFFHPDRWTFGQKLRSSEIIGRMQKVQGVDHVKSVSMKRWNSKEEATNEITEVASYEIIRVRNNPDFTEEGYIDFDIGGGRQ